MTSRTKPLVLRSDAAMRDGEESDASIAVSAPPGVGWSSAQSGSDASSADSARGDSRTQDAWQRPTGVSLSDYPNWKAWSHRRWAWEFLRRNQKFQTDCKDAEAAGRAEMDRTAYEFGLKRFKDFRESYSSGVRVSLLDSVRSLPHREEFARCLRDSVPIALETWLRPGEVAIKFRLLPTRDAKTTVLKAQLAEAKKTLESFAELLRAQRETRGRGKGLSVHELSPDELIKELMTLDVFARENNAAATSRAVAATRRGQDSLRGETDPKRNSDAGTDVLSRAQARAEWGYLLFDASA